MRDELALAGLELRGGGRDLLLGGGESLPRLLLLGADGGGRFLGGAGGLTRGGRLLGCLSSHPLDLL